jgi:branched-chain amino acid transport system substrate-binding protein
MMLPLKKKGGGQMKKLRLGVFIVLVFMLVFTLSISPFIKPTTAAEKELKIGGLWGLSGPGSEVMSATADGEKVTADWINNKGGLTIKGEKYLIKLIGEDMKMSPDGTVAATNKLVFSDKVKFLLGTPVAPFKFAAETITGPNKVIRMDMSSLGAQQELNANTPYTFTGISTVGTYDPALDYFLQTYPQVKKVAVVAPEDPGAHEVNKDLRPRATMRGLTVVAEEYYPFGSTDFYPMWTKILAAKPDAILITVGFSTWNGGVLKQGRELGFKGPMLQIAYPGGEISDIRNVAGKDFTTDYVVIGHALNKPEAMTPMMNDIAKEVRNKFGVELRTDHLLGFESLWYLTQAIEKAQSLDPIAVMNSFGKMTKIETPYGTGTMGGLKTFGINHVVVRPLSLVRFMNGEPNFIKWYTPVLP